MAAMTFQYIAFLCVLDSIHKKQQQHGSTDFNPSVSTSREPVSKHRKTAAKKDAVTPSFDNNPSKMDDRPPASCKQNPTKPFQLMFDAKWLAIHPSEEVIEGMPWLKEFYLQAKEGGLSVANLLYLEQLTADQS